MSIPIGWSQLKPELSNEIKEVILKCLEVDQHKRASTEELSRLAYFRAKEKDSNGLGFTSSQRALNKYRTTTDNAYVPRKAGREMSDYIVRTQMVEPQNNAVTQSFKKKEREQ